MTNNPALKQIINQRIQAFAKQPLRQSSLDLLAALGYKSDRTIETISVQDFRQQCDREGKLNHPSALVDQWQNVEFLFQLTDEEISSSISLFRDNAVRESLFESYVFIAINLRERDYARGKLAGIARQINRIFPMPVMVLFKIGDKLSLAVINRRANKQDEEKDVLGKVTLIQNISIAKPHPGHLDILASFSLNQLSTGKRSIQNFDQLHAAWEEVFNVELLNRKFYEELSNWYFWARQQVQFPGDIEPDEKTRNATSVIRLLTRLIFCWFLKEKGLIPDHLFDEQHIRKVLKNLDDESSSYYQAILQNLFFATLNNPMNSNGVVHRQFAVEANFQMNRVQYGVKNLYRYLAQFLDPDSALSLFEDVPFLNGGLFACLDVEDDQGKIKYADGFSRNPKKQPQVPNRLFFAESQTVDLSGKDDFGDGKKKNANVRGLLRILNGYKFTITESTPVEQEIALDPELLGNVFENLLASYNPETGENARRQTGSFYTPRAIVDHMVDETLKAYLCNALCQETPSLDKDNVKSRLNILFAYSEQPHTFTESECRTLIAAIHSCNILDPACGSGAYPMGILHKLVFILGKLDPHNEKWRQRQISKADEIEDNEARDAAIAVINSDFANNALDYGRKLYLIENCIFGVDIQPIAIQIAKLRFFISLICDQKTHSDKSRNLGIRPLPNLETKFVAANSLLGLHLTQNLHLFQNPEIKQMERELEWVRHRYFSAQTRQAKRDLQKRDRELVKKIINLLKSSDYGNEDVYRRIAWNPYDHYSVADFFDPVTMFGPELEQGFDIVIGNPPYVQIQKFHAEQKKVWQSQGYKTYTATGDIYCLFYERGVQLLKRGGQLCYITSNKWMRAGYGDKIREFFAKQLAVEEIIDFGGVVVFNAAVVDTAIVRLSKRKPFNNFLSAVLTREFTLQQSLADYFYGNAVPFTIPTCSSESWVVMEAKRYDIKKEIEAQGISLEKWNILINYGIKTGYNEAFYITTEQKNKLIAEDPRSAELIVPLLRGRDIGRYGTNWSSLEDEKWMINTHNGVKELGVLPVNVQKDYPAIWAHLYKHKAKLETRLDQGDHWSNLRNCAYLNEFKKPKIIYPNMTKYLPFYLDEEEHFYINDKAFILTTEDESLHYLTALLNSTLFRCSFKDNFPNLGEDRRELRKIFMEKIPIKKPDALQTHLFEALVSIMQAAKAELIQDQNYRQAATFLIDVIDACVMEVYFPQHMSEKNLSITEQVLNLLPSNTGTLHPEALVQTALAFYQTANESNHSIRRKLLRIPIDSPELLGVIQQDGSV